MAGLAPQVATGTAGSRGHLRGPGDATGRAPRPAPGAALDTIERQVRATMARELHDRVAQPLTSLLMDLEAFKRSPGDRRSRRRSIDAFQQQARKALYEIRDLLCDLREQEGRDRGFVMRLRGELEARAMRHPHLDIRLLVSPRWPTVIRARCADHLLHVLLEAFQNARLHGGATSIEIALRPAGGRAEVSVSDDGRGLGGTHQRVRPGLGLLGMQERATLLGGRLILGERPGGGARVRLTFPMEVLG